MKLVSIVMPTRSAPPGALLLALNSIKNTATNFDDVEILLRMDDDDSNRIGMAPGLKADFNAKVIIGPRGNGYIDMGVFANDLVRVADSKWCWLMDDDAFVTGDWQTQLAAIEPDIEKGPSCIAEFYQLGPSHYVTPSDSPVGIIMPTAFVKTLDHKNPVDSQWMGVSNQKGWQRHFLKGVTYFHDGRAR